MDKSTRATVSLDPAIQPTISVDEFAEVAGIARSTAFAAVHAGDVPHIRLGRRIRIPTSAVRRLLQLDDVTPAVSVGAGHDDAAAFQLADVSPLASVGGGQE